MKKMLFAFITFLSFSLSALAGVNLNTATQAELETLNNIGAVKAKAIIDYRQKNGGFKSVEELNKVPGIGDKTMASLKGNISVSGPTTVAAPTGKPAKEMKADKSAKAAVVTPAAKSATPAKVAVDTKQATKTDKAPVAGATKAK